MDRNPGGKPIVLFDGWCKLCCSFAGWLLRHDKSGRILLAPLQGETARELLAGMGYGSPPEDSVLLVQDGTLYDRSSAVLRILQVLGVPWRWLYILIYIPRPLRDFLYRIVAVIRYRVFGKRSSCRAPEPEERGRMLP